MTIFSSLLALSSENLVPYAVLGGLALVLLIAFFVGLKQGFSGLKRKPLSWAFGCAVFAVLELFCHEMVANALPMEGALKGLLVTVAFLAVALLLRFIVFAGMEKLFANKFESQLAKAESVRVEEMATGEFVAFDENRLQKHIPYDGKEKPCAINRFFGGIFSIVIVLIVLGFIASIALVVLNVTPFKESLSVLYENEVFVKIFGYLRTYTLDFLLIALLVGVICNGYKSGGFSVFRTVMIFAVYAVAMVGSFYAPFSPWIAEGQPLHFLGQVIDYLGGMVVGFIPADMPIAIPEGVVFGAVKVVLGLVLCIVLSIVAKMVAWLLNKMQDSVDESDSACVIDGIFGSIIYFFFGVLLVGLVCGVLYLLRYYGVYDTGVFFTESSPIVNGFFGVFEELLKPYLESLGGMIGM